MNTNSLLIHKIKQNKTTKPNHKFHKILCEKTIELLNPLDHYMMLIIIIMITISECYLFTNKNYYHSISHCQWQ
ncbi:hypothetical protein DC082_09070 [Ignatzschineria indica]|uniref:Uncharacterized protein n=1 Tax=Ignatzschineria indica TaxID=472583 RepID=A0A2U2AID2_9GAMM|nr:hypothetical protein DC082_09070 [Ignatzschineria indica]